MISHKTERARLKDRKERIHRAELENILEKRLDLSLNERITDVRFEDNRLIFNITSVEEVEG